MKLNQAGKDQVAIALILLKDWKCDGRFDVEITMQIIKLAEHLGVKDEYDKMITQIPPMKITPRHKQ